MTILVTGASDFISRRRVEELCRRGAVMRVLVTPTRVAESGGVSLVKRYRLSAAAFSMCALYTTPARG